MGRELLLLSAGLILEPKFAKRIAQVIPARAALNPQQVKFSAWDGTHRPNHLLADLRFFAES
jgi:hypothetical protein